MRGALHGLTGEPARHAAADIVAVLLDAFAVEPDRRAGIVAETAVSLGHAAFTYYLATLDGEPGCGRPTRDVRRRQLPVVDRDRDVGPRAGTRRAVTAAASADAVAAGSDWTYLGVFSDNDVARRVYARSGSSRSATPCPISC